MENENHKLPSSNPTGSPVMDIQTPQPVNPTFNPVSTEPMVGGPAIEPVVAAPLAVTPVSPVAQPAVAEALSGTEPVGEVAPGPIAASSTPSVISPNGASEPAAFSSESVAENSPAAVPKPVKKHGPPIFAVLVAIIITLALLGVAVYAYMKSKNKDTSPTTTTTTPAVNSVSPQDIDATSTAIDSNLQKVDEAKDFPTTDLSDSSLSLQ